VIFIISFPFFFVPRVVCDIANKKLPAPHFSEQVPRDTQKHQRASRVWLALCKYARDSCAEYQK